MVPDNHLEYSVDSFHLETHIEEALKDSIAAALESRHQQPVDESTVNEIVAEAIRQPLKEYVEQASVDVTGLDFETTRPPGEESVLLVDDSISVPVLARLLEKGNFGRVEIITDDEVHFVDPPTVRNVSGQIQALLNDSVGRVVREALAGYEGLAISSLPGFWDDIVHLAVLSYKECNVCQTVTITTNNVCRKCGSTEFTPIDI